MNMQKTRRMRAVVLFDLKQGVVAVGAAFYSGYGRRRKRSEYLLGKENLISQMRILVIAV
jgi:hypothetical protein